MEDIDICRIFEDKWRCMAKKVKSRKYILPPDPEPNAMHEPEFAFNLLHKLPSVDDLTYKRFQRFADKIPFITLKEWSHILHLSERTLQRYAKSNTSFEGIYTDRILHIQQLIEMGLETFSTAEAFYQWLKREKNVLGHLLNFDSLYSTQGIQQTIDEIGRIQYGVYI